MGFFNKQRTDGRTYDGQGEERKGLSIVFHSMEKQKTLYGSSRTIIFPLAHN